MSVLTLYVDEVMRTLSNDGQYPFVVNDKTVDIVRFALNTGFTDVVLDENTALRVMYQRPGESQVRAQTLTYYDTDGLHNYYDWQLSQSDLAKNGSLTVALCILDISGGEVSEWHTTPCAVRVLPTIHTDDSDEGDDTITPTVAQRVAVLETMIQRVASGAPIVVASTSAMTDTDQIYVLSTDGNWYYHNGTTWTAGGTYGAVATDTTLTQAGMAADAKATGDEITNLKSDLNGISDKVLHFSPNLLNFDDPDFLTGYYINPSNGNKQATSTYNTTGYIPVEEGETYTYTYGGVIGSAQSMRFVTAYNANKAVISAAGAQSVTKYTVPENVAYIRVSATANHLKASSDNIMIYKGTSIDAYYEYYEPYYETIIKNDALDEEFIRETALNNLSTADLKNSYGCAIPEKYLFRQTVGIPETWYKINMATPPTDFIALGVGAGYYTKTNDAFEFPNETALNSSNGFTWAWYDSLLCLIKTYKGSSGYGAGRRIIAENLSNCTALVIGDSTVDFDTMTRNMLDYFTSKGKVLTLLGTIGDGTSDNRNEGRAGWKASDYLTNKSYNGVVNPFYNPSIDGFDFSYYMTNCGYSAVDFVIIQLGINDLYNYGTSAIEPTWDCIKTMIDSIFAYNSGIKVLLNLPTPPNTDENKHGTVSGFLYRNRVIRYNEYAMAQASALYGASKVRPTYCHLILDPDTDIRDNVHPTNAGFEKMAKEVINQINCWQNGA